MTILLASTSTYFGVLGAVGVVVISLIYFAQEKLIYFPDTEHFLKPAQYGFTRDNFEEIMLRTRDDLNIQMWMFRQPNSKKCPTMLFCHSNAGNLSHRLPNIRHLYDMVKCNVLIISYRGYGKSEGSPSEEGIKLDVNVAMEYLLSDQTIDSSMIFIFGRSLGGAVAIDAASRFPQDIKATILENTFMSIPHMVDVVMPWLKVFKPLVRSQWNNYQAIAKLTAPTLFLSGKRDELVPAGHMAQLEQLCRSDKKKMIEFENGQHMTLMIQPNYYKYIREFLEGVFGVW
ncbi:hypothetical protein SAMD00019534_108430, partial [Acytostelium subglobosum LB1]|uniref:hypothetical protein n=1 Tax=Acytostelium subglobosum LB1 TaxID=1410327 RepID=UPI0006448873